MEANFYISQETGLVLRSVQKMKAERPDEYALTLTGVMAKKLGLNLNTLTTMYEKGINHEKLERLIETATFFKSSIKAAGFIESKEERDSKNSVVVRYIQEELNAYRVNGKKIYVEEDIVTDKRMEGYRDSALYVIHAYVNGELPIDFLSHDHLINYDMSVSGAAKHFLSDIKSKGLKVERTVIVKESIEVQREWKIVNGKMEYIKVGQLIGGKLFGKVEYYKDGICSKHILNGKEFEVDEDNTNIKLLRVMASEIDNIQEREKIFGLIDRIESFYKDRAKDMGDADLIKLDNGVWIGVSDCRIAIEDMIFSYFGFNTDVLLSDEVMFGRNNLYARTEDFFSFEPTEQALNTVDENGIGRDAFVVNLKNYK